MSAWPPRTGPTCRLLGGGFYDHTCPRSVMLISRGEFARPTPPPAEDSKGTAPGHLRIQTAASRLFEMTGSNAGSTRRHGPVEAVMMAVRHSRRKKVVVSEAVNPFYRIVLSTSPKTAPVARHHVPHAMARTTWPPWSGPSHAVSAAVVGKSNFSGTIQDFTSLFATARAQGAVSSSPLSGAADRAQDHGGLGRGHRHGRGQSWGCPVLRRTLYRIMTCRKETGAPDGPAHRRAHEDAAGRTGYVITLKAGTAIGRQKATLKHLLQPPVAPCAPWSTVPDRREG
jgi:glycine dehydrogenase subunit 1